MSHYIKHQFIVDPFPSEAQRATMFAALAEAWKASEKRRSSPTKTLQSIFDEHAFWSGNAADGLSVTIGYDSEEKPVHLVLGQGESHALLGGTTGSGKSNLIHVLIHSLCHQYSPEELKLFLLDYKDGLEFKKYTQSGQVWLPHAETISTHNDPAYAISMFDYLQLEWQRRRKVFGDASSYSEFRKRGGQMPRIVIIIDEFHKLFEGSTREEMGERIMQVLKQGRAYGIHLIMATQTLASLEISNLTAMMAQIPIRMALRGGEDDRILSPENLAATQIKIPQCIYNDQFGKESGNHLCRIPEVVFTADANKEIAFAAEQGFHNRILAALAESKQTYSSALFNGTRLPAMPDAETFAKGLECAPDGFAVQIGVNNDYLAKPAFAVLDDAPNGHLIVAAPSGNGALDDNGFIQCDDVWNAVRGTMVRSLSAMDDLAVVYYSPLKMPAEGALPSDWTVLTPKTKSQELLEALQALKASDKLNKVFFVENFEKAGKLQPQEESTGGASYFDEPQEPVETASSLFASIFRRCEGLPFHAILMVRNFSYAKDHLFRFELPRASVNILAQCSQRIAINLSGDDLGTLYPQCYGRDLARKIFFGATDTDAVTQFLPYEQ